MATKILFNGNRIIFDGHADTAAECKAITAMCDSLAANENFKTIVYEKGHAVFEQVSGGESEMFAMTNYVLLSTYNTKMTDLDGKDTQFLNWFGDYNSAKGTVESRLAALEATLPATAEVGQYLKVSAVDENGKITAVETVSAPAQYKLPYTASEVAAKLEKIE